jgi:hypothetical protein
VDETDVRGFTDAQEEHCVLKVSRVPAMLLTPTCDLRTEDYWLFTPLRPVASHKKDVNRSTLFSDTKPYKYMFGVPAQPDGKFEESFVYLHDIASVPAEPFRIPIGSRLATLSRPSQDKLEERIAEFLGRKWGYNADEKVEYDGYYRCFGCFKYWGIPVETDFLKKDARPRQCPQCAAMNKKNKGMWILLEKHKKSRKPDSEPETTRFEWLRKLHFWKK